MTTPTTYFSLRVYDLALAIPAGSVVTYGDLAKAAGGGAMAARSISAILSKAPNQKVIPWHRIVYANGTVWLAPDNEKRRRALYKKEGIIVDKNGRITNFADVRFYFE